MNYQLTTVLAFLISSNNSIQGMDALFNRPAPLKIPDDSSQVSTSISLLPEPQQHPAQQFPSAAQPRSYRPPKPRPVEQQRVSYEEWHSELQSQYAPPATQQHTQYSSSGMSALELPPPAQFPSVPQFPAAAQSHFSPQEEDPRVTPDDPNTSSSPRLHHQHACEYGARPSPDNRGSRSSSLFYQPQTARPTLQTRSNNLEQTCAETQRMINTIHNILVRTETTRMIRPLHQAQANTQKMLQQNNQEQIAIRTSQAYTHDTLQKMEAAITTMQNNQVHIAATLNSLLTEVKQNNSAQNAMIATLLNLQVAQKVTPQTDDMQPAAAATSSSTQPAPKLGDPDYIERMSHINFIKRMQEDEAEAQRRRKEVPAVEPASSAQPAPNLDYRKNPSYARWAKKHSREKQAQQVWVKKETQGHK